MTRDILQRIAKCAPEEMGAKYYVSYGVACTGFNEGWLSETGRINHAEATFVMLDAIEARGYSPTLRIALDETGVLDGIPTYGEYTTRPGWYECWLSAYKLTGPTQQSEPHGIPNLRQEHFGETRAEAVAQAFLHVFEVEPG